MSYTNPSDFLNTVTLGNCLDIMPLLPSQSIDLILCDLPYQITECSWDSLIPFDLLWEQYKRLITPTGAIVLTASQPFTSQLILSNLEMFKYEWIWKKVGGGADFAMAKNKPMNKHESIVVFSYGTYGTGSKNKMKYNPQGLIYSPRSRKKVDGGDISEHRPNRKLRTVSFTSEYTNYPNTILEFKKDKEKFHPTQKPISLGQYLVKTYTNEKDTVLDNCAGSGSFCLAAYLENRNFIGIELSERYWEISQTRLEEARKVTRLK